MNELYRRAIAAFDGEIEVALLCGDSEPTDYGYSRQTANFKDGTNTEEVRFGPYERGFRSAITGFCLYQDGTKIAEELVTSSSDKQLPAQAEISTFLPGSIRITS